MSAESIEIAVVFEDSVVAVEHVSQPKGRRATLALAGAAAVGLAVFGVLAVHAVGVAAENRRALGRWVDVGGAAQDFRPRRLHPLSDAAAALGLVSGVGFGMWALLRRRERTSYWVGRGRGVDFALDVEDTELVRAEGAGFVVAPAPGMSGDAGAIGAAPLRVSFGPTTFVVSSGSALRPAAGIGRGVDRRAIKYAVASTAAHVVLVVLFFLIPAEARGFFVDDLDALRRRARIDMKALEEPKLVPGEEGGSIAPPDAGKPGTLGDPKAAATERRAKIRRRTDEPTLARPSDATAARTAGVLGVLAARRAQLTALAAMTELSSGLDDEDILGGWRGPELGDSRGWGTTIRGDGPGGDGPPGTIGVGPGGPPGPYGPLRIGPPTLPGRRPGPTFAIGTPTVPEGIDKNMIRRYVRQKHAQITHCYERELVVSPGLRGTAQTSFTIDGEGRVITARASGLGAPAVERCLEDVLRSIQFPRGGIINVTSYPFTFHQSGG